MPALAHPRYIRATSTVPPCRGRTATDRRGRIIHSERSHDVTRVLPAHEGRQDPTQRHAETCNSITDRYFSCLLALIVKGFLLESIPVRVKEAYSQHPLKVL